MDLSRNKQEEDRVYQTLYEAAKIVGRHPCSQCAESYSFDNIYMCKKCGKFWGYCCVPNSRTCSSCSGDIA